MSQYMNAIYKRNSRKRAKDETSENAAKQQIAAVKHTRFNSSWDAGEGPSTRGMFFKFQIVEYGNLKSELFKNTCSYQFVLLTFTV